MTLLTDEELVAAARRLDSRALSALHDRHFPGLYRYLVYRTNDEILAEDLASEAFLRLLHAYQKGKGPDLPLAWLLGVARNLAADHFRQRARRPHRCLEDSLPAEDRPEDEADSNLTAAAVRAALAELTDEQQRVLALRFGNGRSLAETAALMRKSVAAVKQLQFRAVAALRRRLEVPR